jgi:hypothetical protein
MELERDAEPEPGPVGATGDCAGARVFVSWAGSRGPHSRGTRLGTRLTEVMKAQTPELKVFHSATDFTPGEEWPERLLRELRQAQYGVVLLEAEALGSPWVGFETGFIRARLEGAGLWPDSDPSSEAPDPPRIFHLLMCSSPGLLARTPFHRAHSAFLTEQGLGQLADALVAWSGPAATSRRDELHRALSHALLPEWKGIQGSERRKHAELLLSLGALLDRYEAFGLATPKRAEQFRELNRAAQHVVGGVRLNTTLYRELAEIALLLRETREQKRFGVSAANWALEKIRETRETLRDGVRNGRLDVVKRGVTRAFYLHNVIGMAQKSIWTTNFGRPGYTMGGAPERVLIAPQEEARDRGVRITRVFVYDANMDSQEIADRRHVMDAQIKAGIEVRVISVAAFNRLAEDEESQDAIGSNDFMIIDNTMLYLTFQHKPRVVRSISESGSEPLPEITATLFRDEGNSARLEAARRFSVLVQDASDEVNATNCKAFPRTP